MKEYINIKLKENESKRKIVDEDIINIHKSFANIIKKEFIKNNFVYILQSGIFYKVGVTSDIQKRISTLQTGNPIKITLVKAYSMLNTEIAYKAEERIHAFLKKTCRHEHLEWFNDMDLDACDNIIKTIIDSDAF